MSHIYQSLEELTGHTPLLHLSRLEKSLKLHAHILAKIEAFNPGGSAKDRVALAMIKDAEKRGLLREGGMIVEPTSGNTGVGLAWIAAARGYKAVFTMPETMSVERRNLLKAYGAEIVLTPGDKGMEGAVEKAREIARNHPGAFIPSQFDNPACPLAHERTTAEEIWEDTDGEVDIFVAGVGTGGTLSGTSKGLKTHNARLEAYAVEPASSPVLSGKPAGPHRIQGIGANFIPRNYHPEWVDGIIPVSDKEAMSGTRMLVRSEGLLCGISSGAALHAAISLARLPENKGKNIVVLLPDTGERYLSTGVFEEE